MFKNIFGFIILLNICFSCIREPKIKKEKVFFNKNHFSLIKGVLYYKNETFTGILEEVDSINKTRNFTSYNKGQKHGIAAKFYFDDATAEERLYSEGKKVGIHKGWYPNGQLKFEFYFNPKGEYHGSVTSWYKNGQKVKAFNYVNGKEEGSQKMWQPDGTLRANFVTKNGERYGLIGLKKCYSIHTTNEDIN